MELLRNIRICQTRNFHQLCPRQNRIQNLVGFLRNQDEDRFALRFLQRFQQFRSRSVIQTVHTPQNIHLIAILIGAHAVMTQNIRTVAGIDRRLLVLPLQFRQPIMYFHMKIISEDKILKFGGQLSGIGILFHRFSRTIWKIEMEVGV